MQKDLGEAQTWIWDEGDLCRRLCHALDIAGQTIKCLAQDGYTDAVETALNLRPEKIISETAMLLLAASTAAEHADVQTRIEGVAGQLIPHAHSDKMRLAVCLEPGLALDYACAHICLSRIGYRD